MPDSIKWETLKLYHRNPPNNKLYRSAELTKTYNEYVKNITNEFGSISNHIMNKYFLVDGNVNNNLKYIIAENTFPYHVEDKIYHYVIWFNPKYYGSDIKLNESDEMIKEIISEYNSNTDTEIVDYIYFENSSSNKSVLGVKHIHIFTQKKMKVSKL